MTLLYSPSPIQKLNVFFTAAFSFPFPLPELLLLLHIALFIVYHIIIELSL
jgi:hypothetical protein